MVWCAVCCVGDGGGGGGGVEREKAGRGGRWGRGAAECWGQTSVMRVRPDGQTTLTVTPYRAISIARVIPNIAFAALAAA